MLIALCSWRHTPFRNAGIGAGALMAGSWRHTPFRNEWPPFCEWASVFMATYAI